MRHFTAALMALLAMAAAASAQPVPQAPADAQRADIAFRLGLEALRSERFAEAARELQKAIDIDHNFKLAYYWLGRSHMGQHQYPDAIAAYERCRELYQSQAGEKFTNQMIADQTRQDDQRQLEISIEQLLKGPQTQTTQTQIAQLRAQQQRIQIKRDIGRNVSLGSAAPAFVSLALGSAYFRAQRLHDAERAYTAALDDQPDLGEAHNNLAVVYMLTGRLDAAVKEVGFAERAGFRVNPQLKEDLKKAMSGRSRTPV